MLRASKLHLHLKIVQYSRIHCHHGKCYERLLCYKHKNKLLKQKILLLMVMLLKVITLHQHTSNTLCQHQKLLLIATLSRNHLCFCRIIFHQICHHN